MGGGGGGGGGGSWRRQLRGWKCQTRKGSPEILPTWGAPEQSLPLLCDSSPGSSLGAREAGRHQRVRRL